MLHPGFLPILNLDEPSQRPLIEVVSFFLELETSQFLTRVGPAQYHVADLLRLREHMDFELILPAQSPNKSASLCLGVYATADADIIRTARAALNKKQSVVGFASSYEEAETAEESGADAVILGPVFGENGIGIHELGEACRTLSLPVFATGGVDAGNLLQIKDAGAYGFCAPEIIPDDDAFEHELAKLTALWDDFSAS